MVEVVHRKTVNLFECLDELLVNDPNIKDRLWDYFCDNVELSSDTYFDYSFESIRVVTDDLLKLKMLLQNLDAFNIDDCVTFYVSW